MADKVWLTDAEVGTRFGSIRQWVWTQSRKNRLHWAFANGYATDGQRVKTPPVLYFQNGKARPKPDALPLNHCHHGISTVAPNVLPDSMAS